MDITIKVHPVVGKKTLYTKNVQEFSRNYEHHHKISSQKFIGWRDF